jgi:hypothetical protein
MARAGSKEIFKKINLRNEVFGFKDNGVDVNIPLYAIRDLLIGSLSEVTNEFILSETTESIGSFTTNSLVLDEVSTLTFNNEGVRGGSFLDYFEMISNNKDRLHLKVSQLGFEITAAFNITNVTFNENGTTTFEVTLIGSIKRGSFILSGNYYLDLDIKSSVDGGVDYEVTELDVTQYEDAIIISTSQISDFEQLRTFVHPQIEASTTWLISHPLKKYPTPIVVDSGKNKVKGEVRYIDINTIEITFTASFSGYAYLN